MRSENLIFFFFSIFGDNTSRFCKDTTIEIDKLQLYIYAISAWGVAIVLRVFGGVFRKGEGVAEGGFS